MTPTHASLLQQKIALRDYQKEALDNVAERFFSSERPTWRQLGVLPTGTGKTVVFASIFQQPDIERWMSTYPTTQQKALVVAHREELLDQAAGKIQAVNPGLMVQVEQADRRATPMADVVVASVATLASRSGRRLANLEPDDFRIVIVDEAHHATAPSYQNVLRYFGFLPDEEYLTPPQKFKDAQEALRWQRDRLLAWDMENRPDRLLLGVTATPKRGDNIGLEAVFQDISFSKDILSMIRAGFLSNLRAFKVETHTDLSGLHTRAGDFAQDELAGAVNNEDRNLVAVKAWGDYALDLPTIAFCVDVAHAHSMAEEFERHGVKAAAVDGTMDSDERKNRLRAFKEGKLTVLTNCNILTEGFDEPKVACILHARPTKSALLYTQMTGRGTRLFGGKEHCVIIDLVDVTGKHRLATAPDLVGLPSLFDAQGEDLAKVVAKIEKLKDENPFFVLDGARSINDVDMRAREVDLFAAYDAPELTTEGVTMTWMKDMDNGYKLSYPGKFEQETMEVTINTLGSYDVRMRDRITSQLLAPAKATLREALAFAEQWIRDHRPEATKLTNRNMPWMNKPVTDAQLGMLARLGASIPPGRQLSCGDASRLISMLLYVKDRRKEQEKAAQRIAPKRRSPLRPPRLVKA